VERKSGDLSGTRLSGETKALRIMELVAPEDRALAEEMLAKKLPAKVLRHTHCGWFQKEASGMKWRLSSRSS